MNKDLHKKLKETHCRIESVISLAGAFGDVDGDVFPCRALKDFFDEPYDSIAKTFGVSNEEIWSLNDEFEIYNFIDDRNKWGFLIEFATPVMKYDDDCDDPQYSWGHYRAAWIYADSFDRAIDNGIAWVESMRKLERDEHLNRLAHRG